MTDLLGYQGKVAVVTGCASGVGAQTARLLKDAGAEVIGLDRMAVTENVDSFIAINLADEASIAAAAEQIGPFDCLFNVAGVSSGAGDPVFVNTVNFLGPRLLTQLLLPKIRQGGAVVNVASISAGRYADNRAQNSGLVATQGFADGQQWVRDNADALIGGGYAVSKEATIVYTIEQALEHGAKGVRFNCIGPGVIETPFIADTIRAKGMAALDAIPKPLARLSQPAEQAAALLFLNSPIASYVNGHVLWVDGGLFGGRAIGAIPA
ncbi:coniferyl-alcohol dehydrogenase [soil metagenome]